MKCTKSVALLLSFFVTACVGGGGGGGGGSETAQTTKDTVFSLFPANYFDSYSQSFALKGAYSSGETVTATLNVKYDGAGTVGSQSAKIIANLITLTEDSTGATLSSLVDLFYSTDINNLMLLGQYSQLSDTTYDAVTLNIIPKTAKIGDFGSVGAYALSDGGTSTDSWKLSDAGSGLAKLDLTTTEWDASGALKSTEVNSWTIKSDGTRTAVSASITSHQSGVVLTMSGK